MVYAVGWCGDGGAHIRSMVPSTRPRRTGRRGTINGFSRASRRRLTDRLMRVPWNDVAQTDKHASSSRAFMLTLTYPHDFPQEPETYHRHLDNFHRALDHQKHDAYGCIWRLEFQKRGAPHFHILVVFRDTTDTARFRIWARRVWFRVVGSNDVRHRAWGADVIPVWRRRGEESALMWYLIKYLGKESAEQSRTGRCWGEWGELATVVRAAVVFVNREAWVDFCRRVRAWGRDSGYLRKISDPLGIRLFMADESWLVRMTAGIDGCQIFAQNAQIQ